MEPIPVHLRRSRSKRGKEGLRLQVLVPRNFLIRWVCKKCWWDKTGPRAPDRWVCPKCGGPITYKGSRLN